MTEIDKMFEYVTRIYRYKQNDILVLNQKGIEYINYMDEDDNFPNSIGFYQMYAFEEDDGSWSGIYYVTKEETYSYNFTDLETCCRWLIGEVDSKGNEN